MFASLVVARQSLDQVALSLDAAELGAAEAARVIDELGAIRRVVDGMVAQVAKRLAEGDVEAAARVARSLGVGVGEVRGALETAKKLEGLAATDRAVREGRLSGREAKLIAGAASVNPAAEADLLRVAEQGLVPLQDACVRARAAVEDPAARAKRQRRQRELRWWTDPDGMWAGRFRLTPEVGGQVKAALEQQVQRIFRAHRGTDHQPHDAYAADALVGFVLGDAATDVAPPPTTGADATVHILIDHGALIRGGAVDG